jgi:hypothetical protein
MTIDVGASPSTIKEARWRITQHPTHRFQIVFEFQRGAFLCFERIVI